MAPELRKTGISVVGDVPWGTHFCHFYETKEDLLDILIPYFKTGLEHNELCFWVVSDPLGEQDAKNTLRQAVPEADRYVAAGQIEIIPHTEWYLKGDTFNDERVVNAWNDKLAEALAKGYDGLRANGSTAWLMEEIRSDFVQYEKAFDENLAAGRMIVLCSYPLAGSSAAEVFDVVHTHQLAVLRRRGNWEVLETTELIQAKQEIKRLNEQLEQRVIERTRELAAANEELKSEIVERQHAEALLHSKEQEFRAIVENAPDQIIRYDREFRRTYVNPAVAKAYGLSTEALVGKSVGSIIDDAGLDVRDDELAQIRQRIATVFETGKCLEFEITWPTLMGHRYFSSRLFPELDGNGLVTNVLGIARDITERKQAEDALRKSEDHLRLVIDTIPAMAWSVRPDGVVDYLNQRWLDFAGLSLEQYVADPMGPIHPADIPRVLEKWRAGMPIGETYEDEMRLRRADGEYRWFLVRTAPLRDQSGKIIKWYGVSTDIDDWKRAVEELKATSQQLRALSASLQSARDQESTRIAREIHDELGGALTSLRWDLEELADGFSETSDSSQLAALRQRIEGMVTLTEATLERVRRLASELRPIALDELGLVEAIEWQVRQFGSRTDIAVQYECSLEKVDLNKEQSTAVFRILQEALTNILRHAQATSVTVTMRQHAGEFLLTINDNGRGISESEKLGTHSLGLLGMRERALLIGAKIDISGMAGKGTVVKVRVPISQSGDARQGM
jgi:PAS domain S-box-containing protein